VAPEQLQALLREAIERALDIDAYHHEQAAEREDAAIIHRFRRKALAGMQIEDIA
jgi:hypothetical protein